MASFDGIEERSEGDATMNIAEHMVSTALLIFGVVLMVGSLDEHQSGHRPYSMLLAFIATLLLIAFVFSIP